MTKQQPINRQTLVNGLTIRGILFIYIGLSAAIGCTAAGLNNPIFNQSIFHHHPVSWILLAIAALSTSIVLGRFYTDDFEKIWIDCVTPTTESEGKAEHTPYQFIGYFFAAIAALIAYGYSIVDHIECAKSLLWLSQALVIALPLIVAIGNGIQTKSYISHLSVRVGKHLEEQKTKGSSPDSKKSWHHYLIFVPIFLLLSIGVMVEMFGFVQLLEKNQVIQHIIQHIPHSGILVACIMGIGIITDVIPCVELSHEFVDHVHELGQWKNINLYHGIILGMSVMTGLMLADLVIPELTINAFNILRLTSIITFAVIVGFKHLKSEVIDKKWLVTVTAEKPQDQLKASSAKIAPVAVKITPEISSQIKYEVGCHTAAFVTGSMPIMFCANRIPLDPKLTMICALACGSALLALSKVAYGHSEHPSAVLEPA